MTRESSEPAVIVIWLTVLIVGLWASNAGSRRVVTAGERLALRFGLSPFMIGLTIIAIGTDMDGGFGAEVTPTDVDTIADLQGFGPVLKKAGHSDDDVNGILHGNTLRFFRRAWGK